MNLKFRLSIFFICALVLFLITPRPDFWILLIFSVCWGTMFGVVAAIVEYYILKYLDNL